MCPKPLCYVGIIEVDIHAGLYATPELALEKLFRQMVAVPGEESPFRERR